MLVGVFLGDYHMGSAGGRGGKLNGETRQFLAIS